MTSTLISVFVVLVIVNLLLLASRRMDKKNKE